MRTERDRQKSRAWLSLTMEMRQSKRGREKKKNNLYVEAFVLDNNTLSRRHYRLSIGAGWDNGLAEHRMLDDRGKERIDD